MPTQPETTMRFRNFGGIHQFMIEDEADLARIDALDPARWAATSAPIRDLHCDPAFLAALDPLGTGRIRVSQLVAARDWLFARLANRAAVRKKSDVLSVSDLDSSHEAGAQLLAAAAHVARELALPDPTRLSLADVRAFRAGYQKTLANGDGVVPATLAPDPEAAQLVRDIVATTGGAKDASGEDGVGQVELSRFVERAKAWLAWREAGAAAAVWGEETERAARLVADLDAKIEEYFWHCDLLRQEAPPDEALRMKEDDLRALVTKSAGAIEAYLASSPIAPPSPTGALLLPPPGGRGAGSHVNPIFREQVETLSLTVLPRATAGAGAAFVSPGTAQPLGGGEPALTRASWRALKAQLEPFFAWQKAKPPEPFDALGEARVRAIVEERSPIVAKLLPLLETDLAAAPGLAQVAELEKLLLHLRWLVDLANNFVNFSAIYRPDQTALVEMGSLVIDGRRLDFCLKVADRAGHKKVASESLIYLAYVAIAAKEGDAPAYEVVAPVTAGERGRLRVGKRGIFIDLDGKEWDAQVQEIVENPISVKEAMFAPFRRVSQFVGKKVEDWIASAQASQEKALVSSADKGVTDAQKTAEQAAKDVAEGKAPPPAAPSAKPAGKGLDVNSLIIGGGIALGGIATIFGAIFGLLATLKGWLAIAGLVLAVMALSGLLGWLKLRRRDMGLVLEASGWALNVHMTINRRIGRVFTFTPPLPPGSVKDHVDLLATSDDEAHGGALAVAVALAVAIAIALWYWRGHPLPAFLKQ